MSSRLPGLRGRGRESRALDDLLTEAQSGRSQVLVLRGEAGIGKTALLDFVAASARHCRIARASGVESESELAFAGLHQICAPMLDRMGGLPAPQRDALATAFGVGAGEPPSRFMVGLAVLNLFAEAADAQPLVCLIDDAQWLDRVSAQTLAFVARRLVAERVACVFAVREPTDIKEFSGLPQLVIKGLRASDARALLDSAIPGRLDERIRDRIVAEAQGNPLALLELPRGVTAADMGGGFAFPAESPVASRIERSFLRRVRSLPAETQQLLVTAAAEPIGDVALLRRAAALRGIRLDAATAAEAAGLIELDTGVRFHHPLVRSAAYYAAAQPDRQDAHRALADAIDPRSEPDRRAWHRANAATGMDESIAADLERSADRAQARGGVAAAAAFLARAVELTPDPSRRAARALAAARAKHQAGGFDAAVELLDAAELSPLTDLGRAQATLLRGQIMFASQSASAGLPLLIAAAKQLEPLDATLSRETYRDAFYAALTAGRLPGNVLLEVATAVRNTPSPPQPARTDLLLRGLALVTSEGYAAGAPMLKQALSMFGATDLSQDEGLGWLPLASRMAHDTWEFESWTLLAGRLVELARQTGALSILPSALLLYLSNRVYVDLAEANSLAAEAATVGQATGSHLFAHYGALVLEAWRGREAETHQAIEAITKDAVLRGEGKVTSATQWAAAVLFNGLGRHEQAYDAARLGAENPQEMGLSRSSLVELVEAATRTGRSASAADALRRLSDLAEAGGTEWALGTLAGCRALVSDGAAADALYREAIERLSRTELRVPLARVHLTYGEWLRRENRRRDARAHLRNAYDLFNRIGAEAFAERAGRELQATGETVRKRVVETPEALTAQEAQIARLAAEGMTNPDIGAHLFISPHTVDWHLRKVFVKLGITSRKQLHARLSAAATAAGSV